MLTKCADPNELETAASAEIPANPSTVLWVSIRFDQAHEAVMVECRHNSIWRIPKYLVNDMLSTPCKSLCVNSCRSAPEIPQHLVPLPSPERLRF